MTEQYKKCTECKEDIIDGSFISTIGGGSHKLCYCKANPPKEKKTFEEVLCNSDDQVLVRQLLSQLVPENTKDEIIEKFNVEMKKRHKKRLEF